MRTLVVLLLVAACPSLAGGLPGVCDTDRRFSLALHGGAVWGTAPHRAQEDFIRQELLAARLRLGHGDRAIAVVEAAVVAMEDAGLFNAGRGSTANRVGEVETDAAVMDGRLLDAGAVASVRRLANPVAAARLVMERTPHVLMVGPAADALLLDLGAREARPGWFLHSGTAFPDLPVPDDLPVGFGPPPFGGVWAGVLGGRLNHALILGSEPEAILLFGINADLGFDRAAALRLATRRIGNFPIVEASDFRLAYRMGHAGLEARLTTPEGDAAEGLLHPNPGLFRKGGTVGAVARDRCGDLAAASSTGGFGSKLPGGWATRRFPEPGSTPTTALPQSRLADMKKFSCATPSRPRSPIASGSGRRLWLGHSAM
jgi:beta-aspartyl-peptidase (threonine type)